MTFVFKVDDELQFTLTPEIISKETEKWLPPLDRPCLRISGKFRMNQLKKYLLEKLSVKLPGSQSVRLSFFLDPLYHFY
jgi:hypothetical protein